MLQLTCRIITEYLIDYFYTISSYFFILLSELGKVIAVVKLPKHIIWVGVKKISALCGVEIYFD